MSPRPPPSTARRWLWLLACPLLLIEPARADDSSSSTPTASAEPKTVQPADYPRDASALFRALATIEGLQARFEERKTLALLRAPLVSSGVLYYRRGGYLLRHVLRPSESRVRITPTAVELMANQTTQRIDLRRRPDVKLFVESLTRVLEGDQRALQRAYSVSFAAPEQATSPWRLKLTPKQAPLDRLVRALVFTGRGYAIEQLVVEEANGDRSVTTFRDVDARRRYTSEELQHLFGVRPPTE